MVTTSINLFSRPTMADIERIKARLAQISDQLSNAEDMLLKARTDLDEAMCSSDAIDARNNMYGLDRVVSELNRYKASLERTLESELKLASIQKLEGDEVNH